MAIHLSFAGEPAPTTRRAGRERRWTSTPGGSQTGSAGGGTGSILVEEGFEAFRERFGPEAFTLHHRFYLHVDDTDEFWLSAEDGCEGVAQKARPRERDFGAAARIALQVMVGVE